MISGRQNFRVSPASRAFPCFFGDRNLSFSSRDPIHHEQIRKTHGGKREREGWPGEERGEGKTKNEGERRNEIQQTICLELPYHLFKEMLANHT